MQAQQTPPPAPPPADAPTAPAAPVISGAPVIAGEGFTIGGSNPADLYAALRAQRRVLNEQLESLEEQRQELSSSLATEPLTGTARQAVEQRLGGVDQRITEVGQQIAASEREIARVAGIPGAAVEPPPMPRVDEGPSEAIAIVGSVFTIFVLFPLAVAHARRVWRRSVKAVAALPGDIAERFTRLEQAVESVAIEVERVSEGQRFVTKVLTEGRGAPAALGVGPAQPVEVRVPQPEPAYRPGRG